MLFTFIKFMLPIYWRLLWLVCSPLTLRFYIFHSFCHCHLNTKISDILFFPLSVCLNISSCIWVCVSFVILASAFNVIYTSGVTHRVTHRVTPQYTNACYPAIRCVILRGICARFPFVPVYHRYERKLSCLFDSHLSALLMNSIC